MSNTRRAQPGSPLNQSKFSSSPEFDRGLMANLVAARCSMLDAAEDRELIWFMQYLSHQPGGLAAVANELLLRFSDRLGTRSMVAIGKKDAQNFASDEIRAIRLELPFQFRKHFPLRGETIQEIRSLVGRYGHLANQAEIARALMAHAENSFLEARDTETEVTEAGKLPINYPVIALREICRKAASEHKGDEIETRPLERELEEMCLDPAWDFEDCSPWYFVALVDCLREFHAEWITKQRARHVVTELGQMVEETLDYTLESQCMTMIDGLARTGKTFSAKVWCEQNPGRVRYVEVPSTSDEIGFFRAIAKSLGVSISLGSKAQQLRLRIEETLQAGHLGLVLDEAHYIWPNQIDSRSPLPSRVNWIMTALVNKGVPVCLITTPQFLKNQRALEACTRWTSEQFIGRIGHYQKLPDSLSETDLAKVAQSLLPEGDAKSIELLVCYAKGSAKYLAGLNAVIARARYLARKQQREKMNIGDMKNAIRESVIPSDSALALALADPPKRTGRERASQSPIADELPSTPRANKPASSLPTHFTRRSDSVELAEA